MANSRALLWHSLGTCWAFIRPFQYLRRPLVYYISCRNVCLGKILMLILNKKSPFPNWRCREMALQFHIPTRKLSPGLTGNNSTIVYLTLQSDNIYCCTQEPTLWTFDTMPWWMHCLFWNYLEEDLSVHKFTVTNTLAELSKYLRHQEDECGAMCRSVLTLHLQSVNTPHNIAALQFLKLNLQIFCCCSSQK